MFLFKETLEKSGIADTRTQKLAEALNLLHSAISQCDLGNRRIFADKFPYAVRSAIEYAKIEELNQDLWGVTELDRYGADPELSEWISEYAEYEDSIQTHAISNNVYDMGDYR